MDFLAKNINTGEITYLDILNDEFIKLNDLEIKEYNNQKQKEKLKLDLLRQIDEIDKKRIRALAEPQLKKQETGETWLEFYTTQIQSLRAEITAI